MQEVKRQFGQHLTATMVKEEGYDVKYGLKKGLGGTKGNWVDPAIQKAAIRYRFIIFSEYYYI